MGKVALACARRVGKSSPGDAAFRGKPLPSIHSLALACQLAPSNCHVEQGRSWVHGGASQQLAVGAVGKVGQRPMQKAGVCI